MYGPIFCILFPRVNLWVERPLSQLLIKYAADDARLILELWRRMSAGPKDGESGDSRGSLGQALSQLQVGCRICHQPSIKSQISTLPW